MPIFHRVTIIGLGLIGGSLGMAIRRKRLAREIIGFSRKRQTLALAKRRGAIDAGTTDLRAAVRAAQVVVIATPVDTIVPIARRIAPWVCDGCVLTDVGSTKAAIVLALERSLPGGVSFVGAHPLAGSEQRGMAAAQPALFEGSSCLVTTTRKTNPKARAVVRRLWQGLGCRVVVMSPERHDAWLAKTSHLSHALAWCLASVPPRAAHAGAPPSFAEMTRIAQSDPRLWEAIFLSNRTQLLRAMNRFEARWAQLRALIARGRPTPLRRFLAGANTK